MITSSESVLGAGWPWTGRDPAVTQLFSATVIRHAPTILDLSNPLRSIAYVHDILLACEQLLGFFHDLAQKEHNDNLTTTWQGHTSDRRRVALLSPFSPLHRLLATPPPTGANMYDRTTTQDYCRLACLFNLNLALNKYSAHPDRLERYLQWLTTEIIRNNIDLSLRVEHLYYILMRGFRDGDWHYGSEDDSNSITSSPSVDERDNGECNWLVSRLLCVAKRLDRPDTQGLWQSVQSVLAQNLLLPNQDGAGADTGSARPVVLQWEDEEMRKAVLGDFYPGPVLYGIARAVPDQLWDYSCCPETARMN
jgi:hypothetical protein